MNLLNTTNQSEDGFKVYFYLKRFKVHEIVHILASPVYQIPVLQVMPFQKQFYHGEQNPLNMFYPAHGADHSYFPEKGRSVL
jgi:hypothetical protein